MAWLAGLPVEIVLVLRGLALAAQTVMLGGVAFLLLVARPQGWLLGAGGTGVQREAAHVGAWAALVLAMLGAAALLQHAAALAAARGVPLPDALQAGWAVAGLVRVAMALLLAAALFGGGARASGWLLVPLALAELAAGLGPALLASIASGMPRLAWPSLAWPTLRASLSAAAVLHQIGAALWIGGIPCLLATLSRVRGAAAAEVMGGAFGRLATLGALCIAASGAGLAWAALAGVPGWYETPRGMLIGAKAALFALLLLLALGRVRVVRRLRRRQGDAASLPRLARLELAVGMVALLLGTGVSAVPPTPGGPRHRAESGQHADARPGGLPPAAALQHRP